MDNQYSVTFTEVAVNLLNLILFSGVKVVLECYIFVRIWNALTEYPLDLLPVALGLYAVRMAPFEHPSKEDVVSTLFWIREYVVTSIVMVLQCGVIALLVFVLDTVGLL